jgi:hypothetical protein
MRKVMRSPLAPQFAVGVLFLKKGMPRPGESALKAATVKTKEVLTTSHPCPPSEYLSRDELFAHLDRTTIEIFGSHCMTEDDLYRPIAPSIRANVTDSRSEFGTLGTLVEKGLLESPNTVLPSFDEFSWEMMDSEQYLSLYAVMREADMRALYKGSLVEVNGGDEMDAMDEMHLELSPEWKLMVKNRYRELYRNALELAMEEKPDVKLVALAESLKVRVISKGPALTYFVLKPVQKFLHNILRRFNTFEYTGKPVSAESLTQILFPRPLTEAQAADPMLGRLFHSLDYESATDLFDPAVSRRIVDRICDCVFRKLPQPLSSVLRELFHTALTGHMVEGLPQVWGQLMGSIVSFIVLCVANAAVVRASYEVSESVTVPLQHFPATCNGDDGLVVASPIFSEIWKSIAASAGLKPSVGKTYSHPVYANINSTSYEWDDVSQSLRHIPYVNMGLVYGLKRSGGKADVVDSDGGECEFVASIGAIHRQLISSCPVGLEPAVHSLFMRENRDRLSKVFVPWYVSETYGGVGLATVRRSRSDDVDDVEVIAGPSPSDLAVVSMLSNQNFKGRRPKKLPSAQPILCRTLWTSLVPNCKLLPGDESFMDTATFYLLPRSVMSQKPFSNDRLRRNESAWTFLRRLSHRVMTV